MQLESHATPPPEDTPQQRRAALHRAIQRGLDSDEVWRDLAEVCLELGFDDEASRCVRRLHNPTVRLALESKLSRKGRLGTGVQRAPSPTGHSEAPAASNAGPQGNAEEPATKRTDRFEIAGLTEHLIDAVQFLFVQHMPWLVLLTTLAFPLVVGLGGFLTAGNCPLSLAALAALPGLCVLAVVGATGRRILVDSSRGGTDVPAVASIGPLLRDARHFLVDATVVLGSLLGPSVVALACGAPVTTTLPGLLIGLFFTPLAWGLRQVRRDLGALSPVTLLRGVKRSGLGYVGLATLCVGMFAPAGLVAWAVFGRPVWVQIAIIGPLCVVPLFVASRLLGTWLDSMRLELGAVLIGPQNHRPRDARTNVEKSIASRTAPAQPRQPRRPEALAHFDAPKVTEQPVRHRSPPAQPQAPAPAAPAAASRRPATAASKRHASQPVNSARPAPSKPAPSKAGPSKPAPSKASPSRPAKATPATPAPARAPAPAAKRPPAPAPKPEPRAIEGRSPRRPAMTDTPDLSTMPGAVVVSGQERVKQGAAARPR